MRHCWEEGREHAINMWECKQVNESTKQQELSSCCNSLSPPYHACHVQVVRHACGGWRRPHAISPPDLNGSLTFAYVTDERLYTHHTLLPDGASSFDGLPNGIVDKPVTLEGSRGSMGGRRLGASGSAGGERSQGHTGQDPAGGVLAGGAGWPDDGEERTAAAPHAMARARASPGATMASPAAATATPTVAVATPAVAVATPAVAVATPAVRSLNVTHHGKEVNTVLLLPLASQSGLQLPLTAQSDLQRPLAVQSDIQLVSPRGLGSLLCCLTGSEDGTLRRLLCSTSSSSDGTSGICSSSSGGSRGPATVDLLRKPVCGDVVPEAAQNDCAVAPPGTVCKPSATAAKAAQCAAPAVGFFGAAEMGQHPEGASVRCLDSFPVLSLAALLAPSPADRTGLRVEATQGDWGLPTEECCRGHLVVSGGSKGVLMAWWLGWLDPGHPLAPLRRLERLERLGATSASEGSCSGVGVGVAAEQEAGLGRGGQLGDGQGVSRGQGMVLSTWMLATHIQGAGGGKRPCTVPAAAAGAAAAGDAPATARSASLQGTMQQRSEGSGRARGRDIGRVKPGDEGGGAGSGSEDEGEGGSLGAQRPGLPGKASALSERRYMSVLILPQQQQQPQHPQHLQQPPGTGATAMQEASAASSNDDGGNSSGGCGGNSDGRSGGDAEEEEVAVLVVAAASDASVQLLRLLPARQRWQHVAWLQHDSVHPVLSLSAVQPTPGGPPLVFGGATDGSVYVWRVDAAALPSNGEGPALAEGRRWQGREGRSCQGAMAAAAGTEAGGGGAAAAAADAPIIKWRPPTATAAADTTHSPLLPRLAVIPDVHQSGVNSLHAIALPSDKSHGHGHSEDQLGLQDGLGLTKECRHLALISVGDDQSLAVTQLRLHVAAGQLAAHAAPASAGLQAKGAVQPDSQAGKAVQPEAQPMEAAQPRLQLQVAGRKVVRNAHSSAVKAMAVIALSGDAVSGDAQAGSAGPGTKVAQASGSAAQQGATSTSQQLGSSTGQQGTKSTVQQLGSSETQQAGYLGARQSKGQSTTAGSTVHALVFTTGLDQRVRCWGLCTQSTQPASRSERPSEHTRTIQAAALGVGGGELGGKGDAKGVTARAPTGQEAGQGCSRASVKSISSVAECLPALSLNLLDTAVTEVLEPSALHALHVRWGKGGCGGGGAVPMGQDGEISVVVGGRGVQVLTLQPRPDPEDQR